MRKHMNPDWQAARASKHDRASEGALPGRRFEQRYWRRQRSRRSRMARLAWPALGIVIVACGLFLLPAPGPGIPVVLLGLAMVAENFLWVARLLDACEPPLRGAWDAAVTRWRRCSIALRIALAFLVALLLVSSVFFSLRAIGWIS